MKCTTANHRHRKSEQPAAEPGWRPMKPVPPTRESFAQGFRTQAKGIREQLVRLGHSQQHPDLPELYDLYQQSVERWTKSARQDLADCPRLLELPALPKRANPNPSGEPHVIDWYGALVLLREYCEQVAGLLEQAGKPHEDTKVVAPSEGDRSSPMSKATMMALVQIDSYKTFNAWAKTHDIKEAGNRQTYTIRLDTMDTRTRAKFEKK